MSFIEDFISGLFQELIPNFVKIVGASIRWLFFNSRYDFKTILTQNWNHRIGTLFIVISAISIILIINT